MKHIPKMYVLAILFLALSCQQNTQIKEKKVIPYDFELSFLPKLKDIATKVACHDGPVSQKFSELASLEKIYLEDNVKPISPQQQQAIQHLRISISSEYKSVNNRKSKNLERILADLVAVVRKELPNYPLPTFRIQLIKHKKGKYINAFTPGSGYIYFTTDLYNLTESDSERAFIIAHEIGHNLLGHCLDAAIREQVATHKLGQTWGKWLSKGWNYIADSTLDQVKELACDLFACHAVAQSGIYDPQAGIQFFHQLSKLPKSNSTFRIFSTHPLSEIRKTCVNDYLWDSRQRFQKKQKKFPILE